MMSPDASPADDFLPVEERCAGAFCSARAAMMIPRLVPLLAGYPQREGERRCDPMGTHVWNQRTTGPKCDQVST